MHLNYRHDPFSNTVRVWRDDWSGDQFIVISHDELKVLEKLGRQLGLIV